MSEDEFSPIEFYEPKNQIYPVVLSSPHSGRFYSPVDLSLTHLKKDILRKSEDALIDKICWKVSNLGVPFIAANFPRVFLDVNRSPLEIDSDMFFNVPNYISKNKSLKVRYGLGVIPRVSANGVDIYGDIYPFSMARKRLLHCYFPYHRKLKDLLSATYKKFGVAILLDCHSMPSIKMTSTTEKNIDFDIILGDNFGYSSGPEVYIKAEQCFKKLKFNVVRNKFFSGGFITRYYGNPSRGFHAIQIEINRLLYLKKDDLDLQENAKRISISIRSLIKNISKVVT